MTDIEKLKEVFLNQVEKGIKSGDWTECECVYEKRPNGTQLLEVPSAEITFVFNRNGRFMGVLNWRE